MAIAYSDVSPRQFFGDSRWGYVRKIKAERGHPLPGAILSCHAIDLRVAVPAGSQHLQREHFFIAPDYLERFLESASSPFQCLARAFVFGRAFAEAFQVTYRSVHSCHVFVDEGPGFDFSRRLIGNEIFAEGWKLLEQFTASPKKTHMRRENLVTRTHQVVTVEGLNVDQPVRAIVHTVEKDFGTMGVCYFRRSGNINNRSDCIRGEGAGHQSRRGRYQRDKVPDVQVPTVSHFPPNYFGSALRQIHPGGDVGFVIHVGHHDLVPFSQRSSDGQTHQTDK